MVQCNDKISWNFKNCYSVKNLSGKNERVIKNSKIKFSKINSTIKRNRWKNCKIEPNNEIKIIIIKKINIIN